MIGPAGGTGEYDARTDRGEDYPSLAGELAKVASGVVVGVKESLRSITTTPSPPPLNFCLLHFLQEQTSRSAIISYT